MRVLAKVYAFRPAPLTWEDVAKLRATSTRAPSHFASNRPCVCGHKRADHDQHSIVVGTCLASDACRCSRFRPSPVDASDDERTVCAYGKAEAAPKVAKLPPAPWRTERAWVGPEGVARKSLAHLEKIEALRFTSSETIGTGRNRKRKATLPSLSALLKTDAWKGATVTTATEAIELEHWRGREHFQWPRTDHEGRFNIGPNRGAVRELYVLTHPSGATMRLLADGWAP